MKEKFIKSTIILIIGGLITKVLGMLIRIITTRIIGIYGIGLYMIIMPTYTLFITIATLSLPIAISKLVSENKRNNKNIVLGIIPIALIFNLIIILLIVLSSNFISSNLLHNKILYCPILATSITLPFITISNIIRGYFFGKEKMIPHVTSNLFEQIIRLALIILITPKLLKLGTIYAITGLILFNIISEILSIIILIFFIPKNAKIKKDDIKPNLDNIKDTFSIAVPTTASRIINSIGGFLEPIIITFVLLKIGYNTKYITYEYGIISGFVFPMVMMPQFISGAISQALLPTISKYDANNNYFMIRKKLKQAILFSSVIGIIFTIILTIFPNESLKLIFNETSGVKYLVWASPIFLITYIQGPIVATLQAMNKAKTIMTSSLLGTIIKSIILYLFLYLDINMYALLIAIFIQYIFMTIYQIRKIKKILK